MTYQVHCFSMDWQLEPRRILMIVGGVTGAIVAYLVDKSPIVVLSGALAAIGVVDIVVYITDVQDTGSFRRQTERRATMAISISIIIILYQAIIDTLPPLREIPLLVIYMSLIVYGVTAIYDLHT